MDITAAIELGKQVISDNKMTVSNIFRPPNFNDEPKLFRYSALLNESWLDTNTTIVGAVGIEEQQTQIRAIGEIIERYYQSHPHQRSLPRFKYCDKPDSVTDPYGFFQYIPKYCDGEKMIREKELFWCDAVRFPSKVNTIIPAECSYIYLDNDDSLIYGTTNGAACGISYNQAIINGLLELIERDAFFLHYFSKSTPQQINIKSIKNPRFQELVIYIEQYRLEVNIFNISVGISPSTIMSCVIDSSGVGPPITIGTACDLDVYSAVEKAVIEAIQIRYLTRHLLLAEHESSLNSINGRAVFWSSEKMKHKLNFFFGGEVVDLEQRVISLDDLITEFPYDYYVTRLSPDSIDSFIVVRVVCPDLFSLFFNRHDGAFLLPRLQAMLQEGDINEVPHPFI